MKWNTTAAGSVRVRRVSRALLLGLALAAGCSTPPFDPPAPGVPEVRFHNWWNYYERGVAGLREGRVEAARLDFERALGLRPGARFGYPGEHWRVRTYGMHVLDGYFPHRELGVCLYRLGDAAGAIPFLETSLRKEPSGRARHYLNLARRSTLTGKEALPAVEIDPACRVTWTRERALRLRGRARGEAFVNAIRINGRGRFLELAGMDVPFDESVPLHAGENVVTVEATDMAGRRVEERLRWVADWTPPAITIARIEREGAGWVVDLLCRDDQALAHVGVDGEERLQAGAPRADVPLTLHLLPGRICMLSLRDEAGNTLLTPFDPADLGEPRAGGPRLADASGGARTDAGAPAVAAASVGREDVSADRLKPSLRVSGAGEPMVVFDDELFLDGEAADGGGLAGVTISGEALLAADRRGGVRFYFSRRLPLDPGTNNFEVAAVDLAGNRRSVTVVALRREPEYLAPEYRLSIGLPPLAQDKPSVRSAEARLRMQEELLRAPVRFRLLEREEGWEYILREQELSASDLVDARAALRIGKMLPAELLIMGRLLEEEGGAVTVYARVVEAADGEVLFTDDVYTPTPDKDFDYQLSGLIMKIEQRFPLVTGRITALKGSQVALAFDTDEAAPRGASFLAVESAGGEAGLRAGRVRMHAEGPVRLDLKRPERGSATAAVVPAEAAAGLKEGDHVYAR